MYHRKDWTLIGTDTVIIILGVLAVPAIPVYLDYQKDIAKQ